MIKYWLKIVNLAAKEILSTKEKTKAFMVKTGIVTKDGKNLTKKYKYD